MRFKSHYSLSASRYTDLAEGGCGRPGLLRSHSANHSLRERGPAEETPNADAGTSDVRPKTWVCWLSARAAGVEGIDGPHCGLVDEDGRKEDESGAKMMVLV